MVVLDVGGRAGRDGALVQAPRLRNIRNVEQRELRAEGLAPLGGVLAHAQQQVAAHGVEVGRVAADLQLSAHPRVARVGEVHGVEGIDLAEGHDVADVVDEAHGIDALALAEPAHLAEPGEAVLPAGQRGHEALALGLAAAEPGRSLAARDPQHPAALGHRPLVEQEAGHRAAGAVGRLSGVRGVELVDRRAPVDVLLRRGLRDEALRGHVQTARRCVHELRARHHGVGVHLRQPPVHVDREDREHVEPGVDLRPPHGPAAGGGPGAPVAGQPVGDGGVREPALQARAQLRARPPRAACWSPPRVRSPRSGARSRTRPGHAGSRTTVSFAGSLTSTSVRRVTGSYGYLCEPHRHDPVPAAPVLRDDEQALAAQQQLVRVARPAEASRAGAARRRRSREAGRPRPRRSARRRPSPRRARPPPAPGRWSATDPPRRPAPSRGEASGPWSESRSSGAEAARSRRPAAGRSRGRGARSGAHSGPAQRMSETTEAGPSPPAETACAPSPPSPPTARWGSRARSQRSRRAPSASAWTEPTPSFAYEPGRG